MKMLVTSSNLFHKLFKINCIFKSNLELQRGKRDVLGVIGIAFTIFDQLPSHVRCNSQEAIKTVSTVYLTTTFFTHDFKFIASKGKRYFIGY